MPRVARRTTGSRWPTNAPSWPGSAPGWRSSGAAWARPAPGAARERTVLAWWRTALAATVVAVLFARLAGTRGVSGAGVLAVPGWLLMLAVARYRVRALRSGHDTPARSTPPLLGARGGRHRRGRGGARRTTLVAWVAFFPRSHPSRWRRS